MRSKASTHSGAGGARYAPSSGLVRSFSPTLEFYAPKERLVLSGSAFGPEEPYVLGQIGDRFTGSVIWSSNRSGNHEIYRLDVANRTARLEPLTENPAVDTFPRFSPDGATIVFNRSRADGASSREPGAFDVWRMRADGSGQERLGPGFHPTFTADGAAVLFSRGGKVVRLALADRREEVLLDAERALGGGAFEPDLFGPALALTVRGRGRRAFGVYDLRRRSFRSFPGDSCQIAWWPGSEDLVWVEGHQGRGGTRIARGGTGDGRFETLIDLPSGMSHEYFPRPSRDGRWLAWSASRGDHDPDRADFDIFLWRAGTPWKEALRISHDPGNDQWPDVRPDPATIAESAGGPAQKVQDER
ncbi:MAG: hypothetical protein ACREQ9_06185 [Candidatus Binatia bacterium]